MGVSRWKICGAAFVPTIAIGVLLAFAGVNLDRNLAIAGVTVAFLTFFFTQYQSMRPTYRSILFIPKSRSPFSSSLIQGVSDALNDNPYLRLVVAEPPPGTGAEVAAWQIAEIGNAATSNYDAICVIPPADDDDSWDALVKAIRREMFVVVLDIKPRNSYFHDHGVRRPVFVGSDFATGGEQLGAYLCEVLRSSPTSRVVVALGPRSSWPALARTSALLYRLSADGHNHRAHYVELDTWDEMEAGRKLVGEVRGVLDDSVPQVHVFCGNDKILMCTHSLFADELSAAERRKVLLIGYDGALDSTRQLVIHSLRQAKCTVDTKPYEQGRRIAAVLVDEYHGTVDENVSIYVRPTVVESKTSGLASSDGKS